MKEENKFDEALRGKVRLVEENYLISEAEESEIWNKVQSKRSRSLQVRFKQIFLWSGALAASLALLLLAYSLFYPSREEKITFSTYSRVVMELNTQQPEDLAWAEKFIAEHCKTAAYICKNPEFTELQEELQLINAEMNDLEIMIANYGVNEFLVQSKIQIENHKSEITFQLIQMLMS
ncbi:MAG: hypothetical protein AAF519_05750 [Bacteroidota bacterium]